MPANKSGNDIVVLKAGQAVRLRPEMYAGDLDDPSISICLIVQGLCHGLDELVIGHATRLTITIDRDVTIADDGLGVSPRDAEAIMTAPRGCQLARVSTRVGERYCDAGMFVLNALSAEASIDFLRDGRRYTQSYAAGCPVTPLLEHPPGTRGTTFRFRPDPEYFRFGIDAEELAARLAAIRRDVPGELRLVDAR